MSPEKLQILLHFGRIVNFLYYIIFVTIFVVSGLTEFFRKSKQILNYILIFSFTPRIVTIASRSALCANEEVKKLKHNHLINEKCMELRKNKDSGEKRQKNDENKARFSSFS